MNFQFNKIYYYLQNELKEYEIKYSENDVIVITYEFETGKTLSKKSHIMEIFNDFDLY